MGILTLNPAGIAIGFGVLYADEIGDWVARLECGHNQHVRHNPPWQNRPWIEHEQSRLQNIGVLLDCKKCDEHKPRDWS